MVMVINRNVSAVMAHKMRFARTCLQQIVQAVHHLQCHGVAHRDIKPENVLVWNAPVTMSADGRHATSTSMDVQTKTKTETEAAQWTGTVYSDENMQANSIGSGGSDTSRHIQSVNRGAFVTTVNGTVSVTARVIALKAKATLTLTVTVTLMSLTLTVTCSSGCVTSAGPCGMSLATFARRCVARPSMYRQRC